MDEKGKWGNIVECAELRGGAGEKKLIFSSFLDPQVFLCFLLCFILFYFWMGDRKFWLNFSGTDRNMEEKIEKKMSIMRTMLGILYSPVEIICR